MCILALLSVIVTFFFCYFENIITQKTWIDTTAEHHPSTECPSVHSSFDSVFIILPLRLIASSNSGVSSVSTVFPVVARLPGDSDRGKQCFELFWLCNGRLASFCVVIQPSFLRDKPHPVTDWMESEACREPMYTWINVILPQPPHCDSISIYLKMMS